jgi:hypothetical protein
MVNISLNLRWKLCPMTQLLQMLPYKKNKKKRHKTTSNKKYAIILKEFLPCFFLFPWDCHSLAIYPLASFPWLPYYLPSKHSKKKNIQKRTHWPLFTLYYHVHYIDQIPSTNCNSPVVLKK